MKKTMLTLLGIATMVLSACSTEGSKTISVTDTKIYCTADEPNERELLVQEEMQRMISVVPGNYEITWNKSKEYANDDIFDVHLTLQLKHEATLNTNEFQDNNISFHISYLDENGYKIDGIEVGGLMQGASTADSKEAEAMVNKWMNSEIGSTIELPFHGSTTKATLERFQAKVHGIKAEYITAIRIKD
ncbi:MAG: hypothetical protein J1F25_01165 [Prevotellaceae bacterium]|nr:hypothetical protein [Prevotellaceae bacterium]